MDELTKAQIMACDWWAGSEIRFPKTGDEMGRLLAAYGAHCAAEAQAEDDGDHDRTMEYARRLLGRRNVHGLPEALDNLACERDDARAERDEARADARNERQLALNAFAHIASGGDPALIGHPSGSEFGDALRGALAPLRAERDALALQVADLLAAMGRIQERTYRTCADASGRDDERYCITSVLAEANIALKKPAPPAVAMAGVRREVLGLLDQVMSYAATARRENTVDWMEGLAEVLNSAAESVGDDSRVVAYGDGFRCVKAKP